jgi:hypothetical protein
MKKFKLLLIVSPFILTAMLVAYLVANRVPAKELPLAEKVLKIMEESLCLGY